MEFFGILIGIVFLMSQTETVLSNVQNIRKMLLTLTN